MLEFDLREPDQSSVSWTLAEQVFSRTAGAVLQTGNAIRVLKDAGENYPAWTEAIAKAKKYIHFESYIIHEDDIGYQFADLLIAKAGVGVKVRVIYDWLGALGKTSGHFWNRLKKSGVEVRCFNPPHIDSPFSWLTRDHRKMISVDGEIAFVTGLCVGRRWVGYPERSLDPWRDTGVAIRGPAVRNVDLAFSRMWEIMGEPFPEEELREPQTIPRAGEVALGVVASVPNAAGLYRLDQLIAALAQKSLWLTDAYFIGVTPYIQALRSAALDGVDVRLLVPGSTDIPILRAISRSGYYSLLEAGVRVFEWNGPMMHAKTAVADGRWARVGSTNLNLVSWIGNYELDIAVEDEGFAKAMEEMYLEDLTRTTEIVLNENKIHPAEKRPHWARRSPKMGGGSVSRAGAGVIRIGSAMGAAIKNHRILGPAEAKIMLFLSLTFLVLSVIALIWPRLISLPAAVLSAWLAISLGIRAYKQYKKYARDKAELSDQE